MTSKNRRPLVAIVGLGDRQARLVARRHQEDARLVFIDSRRADTQFPSSIDYIIVSRCSPHRFWVSALQRLPRDQVAFCGGGLGSLDRAMGKFIYRHQASVN